LSRLSVHRRFLACRPLSCSLATAIATPSSQLPANSSLPIVDMQIKKFLQYAAES
jgi:hypothetical protein